MASAEYNQILIKRKQKLTKLFGEPLPTDIPISEIRIHGLETLLLSQIPLSLFLYHSLIHQSSHLLFFLLEVNHYEGKWIQPNKSTALTDSAFKKNEIDLDTIIDLYFNESYFKHATHIFNLYIDEKSHLCIGLDPYTVKEIKYHLQSNQELEFLFRIAKQQTLVLLEPIYESFMVSSYPIKQDALMVSREAFDYVCELLMKSRFQSLSFQQNKILSQLIDEFCKSIVYEKGPKWNVLEKLVGQQQ